MAKTDKKARNIVRLITQFLVVEHRGGHVGYPRDPQYKDVENELVEMVLAALRSPKERMEWIHEM